MVGTRASSYTYVFLVGFGPRLSSAARTEGNSVHLII